VPELKVIYKKVLGRVNNAEEIEKNSKERAIVVGGVVIFSYIIMFYFLGYLPIKP